MIARFLKTYHMAILINDILKHFPSYFPFRFIISGFTLTAKAPRIEGHNLQSAQRSVSTCMDWAELHHRHIPYHKAKERNENVFLANEHPHHYHSKVYKREYRKRITTRRDNRPRAWIKQISKPRQQHRKDDDEVRGNNRIYDKFLQYFTLYALNFPLYPNSYLHQRVFSSLQQKDLHSQSDESCQE